VKRMERFEPTKEMITIRPIDYHELRKKIERLEANVQAHAPKGICASVIRPTTSGCPVQVYGLDRSTCNQKLPVVVAIGGNYTQANTSVPRTASHYRVEDDLQTCRKNLQRGLDDYWNHSNKWHQSRAASGGTFSVPKSGDYHLVMTNFCLWNTNESWQNLSTPTRADLLENNPGFNGHPTTPGDWAHLNELTKELDGVIAVWVAHGLHSEVFALFRQFIRSHPKEQWLLMPNLAFYYNYQKGILLR
jgi:hypothetical protein